MPQHGAEEVPLDAKVSTTFSTAMDKVSAQGAFSIGPGIDKSRGEFSWAGNRMTFQPAVALEQGTSYTITVSTAARDENGNPLAQAFRWIFTTVGPAAAEAEEPVARPRPTPSVPAPGVVATSPEQGTAGVRVNAAITITFSTDINPATITTRTLTLPVDGTVSYDAATRTATFSPGSALAYGTTYTITVGVGVQDTEDTGLAEAYTLRFTTAAKGTNWGLIAGIIAAIVVIGSALGYFLVVRRRAVAQGFSAAKALFRRGDGSKSSPLSCLAARCVTHVLLAVDRASAIWDGILVEGRSR